MAKRIPVILPEPSDSRAEAGAARQIRIMHALSALTTGLSAMGAIPPECADEVLECLLDEDFEVVVFDGTEPLVCQGCGHSNKPDAETCTNCGSPDALIPLVPDDAPPEETPETAPTAPPPTDTPAKPKGGSARGP